MKQISCWSLGQEHKDCAGIYIIRETDTILLCYIELPCRKDNACVRHDGLKPTIIYDNLDTGKLYNIINVDLSIEWKPFASEADKDGISVAFYKE